MRRLTILILLLVASIAHAKPWPSPGPGRAPVSGGGGGGGSTCTDGVNCLCDTYSDANLIYCNDFENNNYYATTNWVAGGGDRGLASDYNLQVNDNNGPGGGWWSAGTPVSPKVGSTCNPPSGQVCGYREWCSDFQSQLVLGFVGSDCWDGNSGSLVDIQRSGDFDEEVPGLTLTGGKGVTADIGGKGRTHLAYRVPPGNEGTTIGGYNWGDDRGPFLGKKLEIGVTEAVAYSSNIVTSGLLGAHQKGDEWGDYPYAEWWMYGNMVESGGGLDAFPFKNYFWTNNTTQEDCEAAQAAATMLVGTWSGCGGDKMYYKAAVGTGTGQYKQSVHWPFGTWACVQGHAVWTGTAGSRKLEVEVKLNGVTVIHFTNFNAEILQSNAGYDELVFNMYSNTNAAGQGTPSTQTGYRYKDNLIIRSGSPVSCATIGY